MKEMTIKFPTEIEKDLRLFIVLHGGEIVQVQNVEKGK